MGVNRNWKLIPGSENRGQVMKGQRLRKVTHWWVEGVFLNTKSLKNLHRLKKITDFIRLCYSHKYYGNEVIFNQSQLRSQIINVMFQLDIAYSFKTAPWCMYRYLQTMRVNWVKTKGVWNVYCTHAVLDLGTNFFLSLTTGLLYSFSIVYSFSLIFFSGICNILIYQAFHISTIKSRCHIIVTLKMELG